MIGAHFPHLKAGRLTGYDPDRRRKILVTAKERRYLQGKIREKGLTLVPFSFYPKARRIKLAFGLCRGKKTYDKREQLKKRDAARSTARFLRGKEE